MKRSVFILAAAALGLMACAEAFGEIIPHNVCRLPGVREVRVHPDVVTGGWMDAILYAFDTWKSVVPGLRFVILVSDQASEQALSCVTSIVPYAFTPPEYPDPVFADTKNGFIRVSHGLDSLGQPLAQDFKRACMLHELGHLLFGFGHTTDMTSIMYPVIQAEPHLSAKDEADARAAFLSTRDGAS